MKLTSEYVQVELKNGTVVAGTVVSVAPNMNTTLKDAKMTILNEEPVTLDTVNLRGNTIRYYVLPETIPLDSMITPEKRKLSSVRPPSNPVIARGRGSIRRVTRGRGNFRGATSGRGRGRGYSNTRKAPYSR